MEKNDYKTIIQHISRLEGQIASVKRTLSEEHPNCKVAATTLHAAARSFASLRETFIACVLEKNYVDTQRISSKKSALEFESLLHLIRA